MPNMPTTKVGRWCSLIPPSGAPAPAAVTQKAMEVNTTSGRDQLRAPHAAQSLQPAGGEIVGDRESAPPASGRVDSESESAPHMIKVGSSMTWT